MGLPREQLRRLTRFVMPLIGLTVAADRQVLFERGSSTATRCARTLAMYMVGLPTPW
jgi:hypothetical protein